MNSRLSNQPKTCLKSPIWLQEKSPVQECITGTLELATFDVSFVCVSLALPGKLVILNSSLVSRMIKIFMGN